MRKVLLPTGMFSTRFLPTKSQRDSVERLQVLRVMDMPIFRKCVLCDSFQFWDETSNEWFSGKDWEEAKGLILLALPEFKTTDWSSLTPILWGKDLITCPDCDRINKMGIEK